MSANDELQAHTCEKMLEFYGDVANNVAQGKVQDLTEQWKKGELKEREYYVKEKSGKITRRKIGGGIPIESKPEIIEVLAPVPSYEEWQKLQSSWVDEMGKAVDLQKALEWSNEQYNTKVPVLESENQQLKELLRESAAYVKSVVMVANDCKEYEVANKHNKLFIDICEAIGEKN